MIRQTSSRNQRNKGRRVKNVLKLCTMVVVCFWLLYQLKHSYNKKSAIDERISKTLINAADGKSNFLKLGRKELPQREEIHSEHEDNSEYENKEEEDQEVKEAIEDLDRGGLEDDEIDMQDHDRDDEQDVQDGDDEDAENGDEIVNEEDKKGYVEYAEELEVPNDQDHKDGSRGVHEENDRKNDASIAAQQEGQENKAKDENGSIGNKLKEIIEETVADKKDAHKVSDNSLKSSYVSITAGNMGRNETTSSNELMIVDDGSVEKQGSEVPYSRIDRFVPDNQVVPQINSIGSSWSENQKLQSVNLSFQHGNLNRVQLKIRKLSQIPGLQRNLSLIRTIGSRKRRRRLTELLGHRT